jgi:hypothetical protein
LPRYKEIIQFLLKNNSLTERSILYYVVYSHPFVVERSELLQRYRDRLRSLVARLNQLDQPIRFGLLGDAELFQGDGWLEPEDGYTWVLAVLDDLVPDRIIKPKILNKQFFEEFISEGGIYPALYITRDEFERFETPPDSRIVIVIRDLRDTLVSYFFSLKHSHPIFDEWGAVIRHRLNELSLEDGLLHLIRFRVNHRLWRRDSKRFYRPGGHLGGMQQKYAGTSVSGVRQEE